jgi:hypothetical protein
MMAQLNSFYADVMGIRGMASLKLTVKFYLLPVLKKSKIKSASYE